MPANQFRLAHDLSISGVGTRMGTDRTSDVNRIVQAYAVGFVTVNRTDPEKPAGSAGSGTLIEFQGIRGVLTAAHVADVLATLPEFGILRFKPDRRFESITCRGDEVEVVRVGGPPYGANATDLAFVRLPPRIEEVLISSNAFFNATVRGLDIQGGSRPSAITLRFVTGIVAELTRKLEPIGNMQRVEYGSINGAGDVDGYAVDADGVDRFDFELFHHADFPPPRSYEGVSGGGVWQLGETDSRLDKSLTGVAYYQSPADDKGYRTLRCHGPSAIYEVLCLAVLDRYAPKLAAEHRASP